MIGGDFWAGYSDLMAGLLLVLVSVTYVARAEMHELVREPTEELRKWREALNDLCNDPELTGRDHCRKPMSSSPAASPAHPSP